MKRVSTVEELPTLDPKSNHILEDKSQLEHESSWLESQSTSAYGALERFDSHHPPTITIIHYLYLSEQHMKLTIGGLFSLDGFPSWQ